MNLKFEATGATSALKSLPTTWPTEISKGNNWGQALEPLWLADPPGQSGCRDHRRREK